MERERQVLVASAKDREKQAARDVRGWQRSFPGKSLIQLLPIIRSKNPSLAGSVIERIERNQGSSLTPEDRVFLARVKSELVAHV